MKKIACILALLIVLTCIPFGAPRHAVGEEGEAERLTATVQMPAKLEAEAELLTDGDPLTYVFFKRESTIRFAFSGEAAHLVTVWDQDPGEITMVCYAGNTKLSDEKVASPFLSTVTELPQGTTAVELKVGKSSKPCLSEVYAYGPGELPETEYQWKQAEHPDVLIIAPFPGDEYRFFGGLLPKLINDGANVAVCYCSDYSRMRLEEGFRTLWTLGLHTYPVRLGVNTKLSIDYAQLSKTWRSAKMEKQLETQIKELNPTVIVIPPDGENEAPEARIVSEFVQAICKKHTGSYKKLYMAGYDAG